MNFNYKINVNQFHFYKKIELNNDNYSNSIYEISILDRIKKLMGHAFEFKLNDTAKETIIISKSSLKNILKNSIYTKNPFFEEKEINKVINLLMNNNKMNDNDLKTFFNNIEITAIQQLNKNALNRIFDYADKHESNLEAKNFYETVKNHLINILEENPTINFLHLKDHIIGYKDNLYFIRLLSRIHEQKHLSKNITLLLDEIHKQIYSNVDQALAKTVASSYERQTLRSPTEIIVDLLTYLDKKDNYKKIKQDLEALFLCHKISIEDTRKILQDIQIRYKDTKLSNKCNQLEKQLMTSPLLTRLHDNIYGRAFDSAFVADLVDHPPVEVTDAMTAVSQRFAHYLKTKVSLKKQQKISEEIKKLLKSKDPRFWFPKVPNLQKLINPEANAFTGLIDYLLEDKKTGFECISIPYLLVKIGLILKENPNIPPYMEKADINYSDFLHPQIHRIRINRSGTSPLKTKGAGITLHYQPSIAHKEWMNLSERPTTVRKPDIHINDKKFKQGKSLVNALEHGLPWASGMSGSTNINLYAWHFFNRYNGAPSIDPKATFLGILMFLVYDGGHSMHEPLWAASQINNKLPLDFNLGQTDTMESFVSDYQKFADMYTGALKERITQAFSNSFEKAIEYFNNNSYYKNQE